MGCQKQVISRVWDHKPYNVDLEGEYLELCQDLVISCTEYLTPSLSTANYTCPGPLPWHLLIAFPPISGPLKIEKSLQGRHFKRFAGPITPSCFSKLTSPFLVLGIIQKKKKSDGAKYIEKDFNEAIYDWVKIQMSYNQLYVEL